MYLKSKTYPAILAVSCLPLRKDRAVRLAEWDLVGLVGVLEVWDLADLAWALA